MTTKSQGWGCPWCGRRRHQGRCRRWYDAHPLEHELNNNKLRQGRNPDHHPPLQEPHHPRLSPARVDRARVLRVALDVAFLRGDDTTLILREMRELLEAQVKESDDGDDLDSNSSDRGSVSAADEI
jgi:hypothetical protein